MPRDLLSSSFGCQPAIWNAAAVIILASTAAPAPLDSQPMHGQKSHGAWMAHTTNSGALPVAHGSGSCRLVAVAPMGTARAAHTATTLIDGRILITGGMTGAGLNGAVPPSAELFVPDNSVGHGEFRTASPMTVGRKSHTATRLVDGRVLITGGLGEGNTYLASAELYDPETGRFTVAGRMRIARADHVATLLADGRVLLAGGVGEGWTFLSSAEIYDPRTNSFQSTGSMRVSRESHTATRLADGTVLIIGGHSGRRAAMVLYATAERFDPRADGGRGAFHPAPSMAIRRHKHDAVALADGRVLVTGGADERDNRGTYRSAEIFDPQADRGFGRFMSTGDLRQPRYKHALTSLLLRDGSVLVAGGATVAERYNPTSGQFAVIPSPRGTPPLRGLFSVAAPLRDGSVLVAGGYGSAGGPTTDAWLIRGCTPGDG